MADRVNRFVQVEMKHQALAEPQFIIRSGSTYYVTLAVWAYDVEAEGCTPAQVEGVRRIKELFEQLERDGCGRKAVEIPVMTAFIAGFTSPG